MLNFKYMPVTAILHVSLHNLIKYFIDDNYYLCFSYASSIYLWDNFCDTHI